MARADRDISELGGTRGIGHRPEIATELLVSAGAVDFIEVVAESCFVQERTRREVLALAEVWPVVPHGVKLSLGSAAGVDLDRAQRLGDLARAVRAPVITEHVALTSAGAREIGHLTPVPRSMDVVRVVGRNVRRARAKMPDVPMLLENIAVPFGFASDAMEEPDFYAEIVEETGCDLLLDVANLYANAINAGRDPVATALAFPLERVKMIHLAGGVFEDGFYFDTHAHAVADEVFDVLAAVLSRAPGAPVVLERDAHFEDGVAPLLRELDRAEALRSASSSAAPLLRSPAPRDVDAGGQDLARDQAELAELLVRREPPAGALAVSIGLPELERARSILQRKRVDDALPVLTHLSRRTDAVRPIAERVLGRTSRAVRMQGIADALAIADAVVAAGTEPLADAARRDRAVLRARFALQKDEPSVRVGPYVARERLSSGAVIWAVKGFGAAAQVHVVDRGMKGTQ